MLKEVDSRISSRGHCIDDPHVIVQENEQVDVQSISKRTAFLN